LKPDSSRAPFAILRGNVFGDEYDLGVPANERTRFGVGLRGNQREHRTPVRWSNRNPALAGSKADIADQTEPKLIQVKSQTLILVADVDVDRVDAKVKLSRIHGKSRLLRVKV
jgi:hypothetical protein